MPPSEIFSQALNEWAEVFMHRSFREIKHFMDESGLSVSQVNTLMRLYYHGTCGVTEIAQSLGITNAAASQLVDKLVSFDLIDRTEDEKDRRVKQIRLTESGHILIRKGITLGRSWMENLTTNLSSEDQEAIIEALTMLTHAARQLEKSDYLK